MRGAGGAPLPEFRVFETEELKRRIARLPRPVAGFIENKLRSYVYPQLRADPYSGPNIRKLRGYAPDTWRYRIGRFRVFHTVDEEERIVFVPTLDDRKDAYR